MGRVRLEHKYILYVWNNRLDRYVECRKFNSLEKVQKWHLLAKEEIKKPHYLQSTWVRRYIPFSANLDKYYIRYTAVEIEETLLIDEEVVRNE